MNSSFTNDTAFFFFFNDVLFHKSTTSIHKECRVWLPVTAAKAFGKESGCGHTGRRSSPFLRVRLGGFPVKTWHGTAGTGTIYRAVLQLLLLLKKKFNRDERGISPRLRHIDERHLTAYGNSDKVCDKLFFISSFASMRWNLPPSKASARSNSVPKEEGEEGEEEKPRGGGGRTLTGTGKETDCCERQQPF